jgi:hypothetical protein
VHEGPLSTERWQVANLGEVTLNDC